MTRSYTIPEIYCVTDVTVNSHFGAIFCPLPPPPQQPKKLKFWKNEKKTPRDIITLNMCTKNYDQMIYGS